MAVAPTVHPTGGKVDCPRLSIPEEPSMRIPAAILLCALTCPAHAQTVMDGSDQGLPAKERRSSFGPSPRSRPIPTRYRSAGCGACPTAGSVLVR